MTKITNNDKEWIEGLRRYLRKKPKMLRFYVEDRNLVICKKGVLEKDFAERISMMITVGYMVSEMHETGINLEHDPPIKGTEWDVE